MSFSVVDGCGILPIAVPGQVVLPRQCVVDRQVTKFDIQKVMLMKSKYRLCSSNRCTRSHLGSPLFLWMLISCAIFAFLIAGSARGQNGFQVPDFKSDSPFGQTNPFGNKDAGQAVAEEPVTLSATFSSNGDGTGELIVKAKVAEAMHIFSVTQPTGVGAPKRTKIRIDDSEDVELTGDFQPNKDPHVKDVAGQEFKAEEHVGEIAFTAPLKFKKGIDPANVKITVKYDGQACEDGEHGSCFPVSESLTAVFAGQQQKVAAGKKFKISTLHVVLSGTMTRIGKGDEAVSGSVEPGDKIRISILAEPLDGFHVYPHSDDTELAPAKATLIAIQKTGNWAVNGPYSKQIPIQKTLDGEETRYYEQPVTWTYDVNVPRTVENDSNTIGGLMLMMTCSEETCDRPTVIDWSADIGIGQPVEGKGLRFIEAGHNIEQVKEAVRNQVDLMNAGQDGGDWEGASPWFVVPAALVAGFILNFMPCVLPVIGLKVMSFMQQAGQNPRRVFFLNVVFCLGMLSVFMVLAFLAVQFGLGWGEQFESLTFKVVMIAVVVVFGLSFFGVWEIPVPGFGGSSIEQKEGVVGAFFKGILTTILATPCSGPLLIPAVVWAISQPPYLTYMVFAALGLGMGLPYVVLGAMPKLTKYLPKPGPWMETFKKIMGFVMMGTAVFLAGSIESKYMVSLLSLLVILGFACWWMGRTPMTAPLGERIKSWGISGLIGAFAIWFSFFGLLPANELDYQQYTRWTLDQHLADGRTVFVDFTADW